MSRNYLQSQPPPGSKFASRDDAGLRLQSRPPPGSKFASRDIAFGRDDAGLRLYDFVGR